MKIGKALTSGKKGETIIIDVDKEFIKQAILEKFERDGKLEEEKK